MSYAERFLKSDIISIRFMKTIGDIDDNVNCLTHEIWFDLHSVLLMFPHIICTSWLINLNCHIKATLIYLTLIAYRTFLIASFW